SLHNQDLRTPDERPAEVEPPLLAAGERLHAVAGLVREPDQIDHVVDVARTTVVAREHAVHLADGERRRQLRLLENDADPLAVAAVAPPRIDAEHVDFAPVARAI